MTTKFRWIVLVLGWAGPAGATYSIAATDTTTRAVGGAGTSCLGGSDVYVIYGSAPGVGVIHSQATYSRAARDRGVELLTAGVAPAEVLAELTAPSFDPNVQSRQFAVVDVTGRSAGFTGEDDRAYAADRQGSVGSSHYSVQGNILTSAAVMSQAAAAFESSACDLPERLLHALEAGARNGEGDSRCTSRGIPSDSAFLQVDLPAEPAGTYLALHVPTSGTESPLPGLRAQFDEWRASHPCPVAGAAGDGADPAATGRGGSGCTCRLGAPAGRSRFRWNPLWMLGLLAAARTARRWNASRHRC
jgi:uncharacterized Ntn-hydrolase superfamily protein